MFKLIGKYYAHDVRTTVIMLIHGVVGLFFIGNVLHHLGHVIDIRLLIAILFCFPFISIVMYYATLNWQSILLSAIGMYFFDYDFLKSVAAYYLVFLFTKENKELYERVHNRKVVNISYKFPFAKKNESNKDIYDGYHDFYYHINYRYLPCNIYYTGSDD